jgi:anhydro-N-acetylmuramic acid kinase
MPDRVLVSGGGANNSTLLEMLRSELPCPVDRVDNHGYGADSKEAALMALLGAFRVDGTPGNVPVATGADRRVVLGKRSGVVLSKPEY